MPSGTMEAALSWPTVALLLPKHPVDSMELLERRHNEVLGEVRAKGCSTLTILILLQGGYGICVPMHYTR